MTQKKIKSIRLKNKFLHLLELINQAKNYDLQYESQTTEVKLMLYTSIDKMKEFIDNIDNDI